MRILLMSMVLGLMLAGVAHGHESDSKKVNELERKLAALETKFYSSVDKLDNADSFGRYMLGCLVAASNAMPKMGSLLLDKYALKCAKTYKRKK